MRSQIRFNSESLPSADQGVVARMAFCTRTGVLQAVNVNWNDDGWNVNANSTSNPNRWNDDNQVFSRNYCFLMILG